MFAGGGRGFGRPLGWPRLNGADAGRVSVSRSNRAILPFSASTFVVGCASAAKTRILVRPNNYPIFAAPYAASRRPPSEFTQISWREGTESLIPCGLRRSGGSPGLGRRAGCVSFPVALQSRSNSLNSPQPGDRPWEASTRDRRALHL